jgi:RNA polymerase sigma factor (sigma-70 family)
MKKGKPVAYTTHEEDKQLVIQAIGGEPRAYNILLQKYKPILYVAAKRRLPYAIPDDLEDIVMAVLGTSFVRLHQYDPEKSKFFTWMVACLHNYVNGIPKQKKRVTTYSYEDDEEHLKNTYTEEATFDEDIDRRKSYELLKVLIKKLPKDYGRAIFFKYYKGYSHEEIAEALGCETSNVWYKLQRGRELLKEMSHGNDLFDGY